PHRAGAAGPRVPRRRCVHGRRPDRGGDVVGAGAAAGDPVPAARPAAAVPAGVPRRGDAPPGRAVESAGVPAPSRTLRGSAAAPGCVGCVDAAASSCYRLSRHGVLRREAPHLDPRRTFMVGYVTLGTNDFGRATRFYDILLAELGAKRFMELENFIVWGSGAPAGLLAVTKPFDGKAATVGNGVMVALAARSRAHVDAIYRKA